MTDPPRRRLQIPFTVWVLAAAASGYFWPGLFTWSLGGWEPKQAIQPLVQLIMLGMGVALTFDDFARVLKIPWAVVVGIVCQFAIMPLTGWACVRTFGLQGEVAAGLILIGSCPGGVSSNVICYLARANVPLSVTLTACTTMLSPVVTPLAMRALAGEYVSVDPAAMMISILEMILIPLLIGLLANRYAPKLVARVEHVLPIIAMLSICIIIAITIALARDGLASAGLALFGAAACHNAVGYLLGYTAAFLLRLDRIDRRTVAIEVGLQNGGMATGLALNALHSPTAALGAAVFGPWSAITSSLLASYWRASAETATPDTK